MSLLTWLRSIPIRLINYNSRCQPELKRPQFATMDEYHAWMAAKEIADRKAAWPDPPVPPPPAPPPTLSCFVQGLIKSMDETPGQWTASGRSLYWEHGDYIVGVRPLAYQGSQTFAQVDDVDISQHESKELGSAFERWMKRDKAEKAAKIRAPFEKLACPDATPPQNSTESS